MSYDCLDPDFKDFLAIDKKKIVQDAPPFDSKVNVWAEDSKEGFVMGEILREEGDVTIIQNLNNMQETKQKSDNIQQMNPPKFNMIEDMADMTFLNEACVLMNLKMRYQKMLIYTYSGLFCIAVNPYKRLPIYGMNIVNKYKGKKRNEVPPHLFSIADNAYSNMLINRNNQSMLITGESGAGKTENTKKVISYFALVAPNKPPPKTEAEKEVGLEDQIIQCNPVLEAYGNAKTSRNNNSSRFGKFIRIHFGPTAKIAGADVDTYLLEKSRITYQQPGIERNYHIFYQLLSSAFPAYHDMLLVDPDPSKYFFINQGCLTVDNMDDCEEMKLTDEAFGILGFTSQEKFGLFKGTCAVLWLGLMKFKQRPREEQAEANGTEEAERVASLLSVQADALLAALLKPRIKVGGDFVTKQQNLDQVDFACHALAKSVYDRMFNWLVVRVNKTLDTTLKKQYFIGVLDIAGFEIFEFNTFEQLCINYTNERLQQFFNHHMFVLEQEEYKKEGIEWVFIDFGMDLLACIELIEKPLGILSILEEECMFPKASDKSFLDKLYEQHMGKSKNFGKPKPDKNAKYEKHFELYHYAGTVGYNTKGWLNKNKDPINECVVEMLAASKEPLMQFLFGKPQPTKEELEAEKEADKKGGKGANKKKAKSSAFQTISAVHRESLGKLMQTLYATHPHFVRCIIPNELKASGVTDPGLILHQLQCNGVLEGIRICRKGFPNRIPYPEFKQRYCILAPNSFHSMSSPKESSEAVIATVTRISSEEYRAGHTKIFFKAGVLARLEDIRDETLTKIVSSLQSYIRGYSGVINGQQLKERRNCWQIVQNNIRGWVRLRNWNWFILMGKLKPMLAAANAEEKFKEKEEEMAKMTDTLDKFKEQISAMEQLNQEMLSAKNALILKKEEIRNRDGDKGTELEDLVNENEEMAGEVAEMEESIRDSQMSSCEMGDKLDRNKNELQNLREDFSGTDAQLNKAREDLRNKEKLINTLNETMAKNDEQIAKLNKDKKNTDESLTRAQDDLTSEEDKANSLLKLKSQLEGRIDTLEGNLEHEKKVRMDTEKQKRKVDAELKMTQETVEDLERTRSDLEAIIKKRDREILDINSKMDDENSLIAQLQKKIKELQNRIEELEEELDAERAARSKVDKQRYDLDHELEMITEQLEEAGGATTAQAEMNKKREMELINLRRELDGLQQASESSILMLKKKQNDASSELADHIDHMTKEKSKIEKERNQLKTESDDLQSQFDMITKSKANAEKMVKTLETQAMEFGVKLETAQRNVNDTKKMKDKSDQENNDIHRQLEDVEVNITHLAKLKQTLSRQLDEMRGQGDEENRLKQKLQVDVRSLGSDVDRLKEQLEEEQENRANSQRLLAKTTTECSEWKRKCDAGESGVSPEMEELKRKLNTKLAELEGQLEEAQSRCNTQEKARNRIQSELEDCQIEMDRAQIMANQFDKKQKAFDKTIEDWKIKVEGVQADIERATADGREHQTGVYTLKAQLDESLDSIENMRKENKTLSDEIHDMTEQLGEGGRSVHELEKSRKRLEMEKAELQTALEEAEAMLEQEEAKVMRSQCEMASIKGEIDKRILEKDEEFDTTRRNQQRAIDSLQASLEAESRGKVEAYKSKKKLESDINDFESHLDGANRGRAEAEKSIKKYLIQVREAESQLEDERKAAEELREQYTNTDRKASVLAAEIEELRNQLEVAERARKMAEGELHDTADHVSEMAATVATLTGLQRKLETDHQAMRSDIEDQCNEIKISEEQAKKAMADASRLVDELRQEREHYTRIDTMKKALEQSVKDSQTRLDEAEATAFKGGKRMVQKLEQKVRELEVELDNEQRCHAETVKTMRKSERRLKELTTADEESHKAQERLQVLIESLHGKIKTYKRQVEEAEEMAAMNLQKYRKVQHDLEEAEERADVAENTLARFRAKNRSSLSATRQSNGPKY